MSFSCKCGSSDFHTFYKYESLRKERFRCKKCNRTYQKSNGDIKEINLKNMWNEALKELR